MFSTFCIDISRCDLNLPRVLLPAWGSDWHIEHSTSNDQDFPRQRLSKEWLYAMAAFLWFCTHTHTQKHQPKNIICPHTFFTNFTTPSVTVEAPNVQCQGLSLSVCAGNQGLWQVRSSQIPWTSQQFRSFTQLPGCLANWGVSSYPNVGSLSSLKKTHECNYDQSPDLYVNNRSFNQRTAGGFQSHLVG